MHTRCTGLTFITFFIGICFGHAQILSVVRHETAAYRDAIIRVNAVPGSVSINNFTYQGIVMGVYSVSGGSGSITPGGSVLVNGLAPGEYTFKILSDLGLTIETITVIPYCNFPLFFNEVFYYECNNRDVRFSVPITGITTPATFYWKTPKGDYTSNSAVITGPPGNYEVTVVDAVGCVETDAITIHLLQPINISCTSKPADKNINNGSIELTFSGGQAPYDVEVYGPVDLYFHYNRSGTYTIPNLPAGDYEIYVYQVDYLLCDDPCLVTIPEKSCNLIINNPQVRHVSCAGDKNGSINFSVSGGQSPLRFNWNNGLTTAQIQNLPGGTYSVTVTDQAGCTTTAAFLVNEPSLPPFTTTVTPIPCHGGRGAISINFTSGNPLVRWSDGSALRNRDQLLPGHYEVTISDGASCSEVLEFELTNPPLLAIQCALVSHQTTENGKEGEISVKVSGGTPPYRLNLTGPKVVNPNLGFTTAYTFKDLTAGTYTLAVTDSRGCLASCGTIIIEARLCTLSLASIITSEISCFGAQDGEAKINLTGSNSPTYTLTGPAAYHQVQTQSTFSGLGPGSYNLSVKDPAGCSVTSQLVIKEPPPLVLVCQQTPLTHVDSTNASIQVQWSGGVAPYTLTWSDGGSEQTWSPPQAGQETLRHLDEGTYAVEVRDKNGCIISCEQVIAPIVCTLAVAMQTQVTCVGGAGGQVSLSVHNGQTPFTYTWQSPQQTLHHAGPFQGLADGTYAVTVTDRQGCTSATGSTLLSWPLPQIACAVTSHQRSIGGLEGSITITGTPGHQVQVANQPDFIPQFISPASGQVSLSNLAPGSYHLQITSPQGCTSTCTQDIRPKTCTLSVEAQVNHLSCAGATDGILTLNINNPDPTKVLIFGPENSQWNIPQVAGLGAGTYLYRVEDDYGCAQSGEVVLHAPEPLIVRLTVQEPTDTLLPNGIIALTPAGGQGPYTIAWTTGQTDFFLAKLLPGRYDYTLTDAQGCSIQDSITLSLTGATVCSSLKLDLQVSPTSCPQAADGTLSLVVSGGTSPTLISWSNGAQTSTLKQLAAGKYTVTVTDQMGCLALGEAEVIALPIPQRFQEQTLCSGNEMIIHGQKFQQPGTYLLTLPSQACDTILTLTLKNPPLLDQITTLTKSGDFCGQPNTIEFVGAPEGTIYSIDGGKTWAPAHIYRDLPDGIYAVQVARDGCTHSLGAIDLNAEGFKVIRNTDIISPLTCRDPFGSIALDIPDAAGWEWQLSDGGWQTQLYFDSLPPGNYTLRGRVRHSTCIQDFSQIIRVDSAPPTDLKIYEETIQPSCPGGRNGLAQISVSGGVGAFTIQWNNAQQGPVLTQVGTGAYQVTVTDEAGCQTMHKLTIGELSVIPPLRDTVITICIGERVSLALDSVYHYAWSGPQSFNYQGHDPELFLAGTYQVAFTDRYGCAGTKTVELVPTQTAFLVNFLVPAIALTGTEIKAVENSWPVPDSITWWVEEGLDIMTKVHNTLTFGGSAKGSYKVGLRSYYRGCLVELTKSVELTDDAALVNQENQASTAVIRSLSIAPNPNTGQFKLNIELSTPLSIQLRIYDPAGQLAWHKLIPPSNATHLMEEVILNQAVSGVYTLALQTASAWRTWSFIVIR